MYVHVYVCMYMYVCTYITTALPNEGAAAFLYFNCTVLLHVYIYSVSPRINEKGGGGI